MKPDLYKVLSAQFLTAFADNAILFATITMIMQQSSINSWYIPALQVAFLIAFVIFAPWVGRLADAKPKRSVLVGANIIKAMGAALLIFQVEPLIAYALIGFGAAIYSPAKYGILPEIVEMKLLVKANGWIEGSTILAILSGTLIGALVAERSLTLAMISIIILYILSAAIAATIKHNFIAGSPARHTMVEFADQIKGLLATPRARFSTLGVSLFWAAATVLRLLLIAWAPIVLMIYTTTDIAMLTMFVAIGIAIGSILVPKLIPIAYLRRARMAAYAMGIVIVLLAGLENIWAARAALLLAGICGGLFVVPINAALQEIGHKTIGSGGAVAIQNFFENLAMLIASATYALVANFGVDPVITMIWLGILIIIATTVVSWHLPKDTGSLNN